jgi:hypothetical protein
VIRREGIPYSVYTSLGFDDCSSYTAAIREDPGEEVAHRAPVA